VIIISLIAKKLFGVSVPFAKNDKLAFVIKWLTYGVFITEIDASWFPIYLKQNGDNCGEVKLFIE
jgi:hypothetical protein